MAVISIGRGTFSLGTEVAQGVAKRLDHDCLGREALIEAAREYDVPEIKLTRAIESAPTIIDRIAGGRRRYIAYMRATLLRHFRGGKCVYHGFAGAQLLMDVPQVLKVRLVADLEERISIVVARDNVPAKEARRIVTKADEARRQWSRHLYGVDPENSLLYDTVLHVGNLGVDGAAEVICDLASRDPFCVTPESLEALVEMSHVAEAEALVADMDVDLSDVRVITQAGVIRIGIKTTRRTREGTSNRPRSYFVRDLRDRLQMAARERIDARVIVELIDHETSS